MFIFYLVLSSLFSSSLCAQASDWRLGASIGYGGAGLSSTANVDGTLTSVSRSEGPGMASVFVDELLTDYLDFSLEHIRGFRLGPFSSGVSFTGMAFRWYFWGPAPNGNPDTKTETTLFVRRYTPFVGLATGVALADISRTNDLVPRVTGSGAYIGIRLGADYPIRPGFGIRPQITTSTTFFSSVSPPTKLSEFALECGFYIYL